jgi:hypothetical protein
LFCIWKQKNGEVFAILGCSAVHTSSCLTTFQDRLSVPYSRVEWLTFEDWTTYQSHIRGWTGWPLKMGQRNSPIFEGGLVELWRWDNLLVPYSRLSFLIFGDWRAYQSHILGWTGWTLKLGQPISPIFGGGLVDLWRWDRLSRSVAELRLTFCMT